MDVANFTQEDIRRHLADLGYTNVTDEKLEGFVRDLRKLIKYEERKKGVEDRLGLLSSRSEPSLPDSRRRPPAVRRQEARQPAPDSSTSPEPGPRPRRRVRRKKSGEQESVMAKHQEVTRDSPDGSRSDTQQSSIYIDVDLPPPSPPSTARSAASASLLERPPPAGPGFIRARSGPSLGRRPASSDPVALHQLYSRAWAKAKIPGERSHSKLRWAVRGWMMGEEPL